MRILARNLERFLIRSSSYTLMINTTKPLFITLVIFMASSVICYVPNCLFQLFL